MMYKHSFACVAACILSLGHGAVIDSQRARSFVEDETGALDPRGSMDAPRHWPGGVVPYILNGYPHDLGEQLRADMRKWESQTCIRFVPKPTEDTWVTFKKVR